MATDVVTTTPATALREAAALMVERKIGCLPVVEDGNLVGILTEADFVAAVAKEGA
jgi:CBS domain-containing protein